MPRYSQDVSAANFQSQVIAASHEALVLVDFWAEWCGPCQTLKPLLEKVVDSYGGRVRLAKIDSDQEQELAARHQVRSIPNVKAFVAGRMVDEFSGALPEGALRAFIERWLPSPMQATFEAAVAARHAGDLARAEALLREAIAGDETFEPAGLELIDVLIERGETEAAEALLRPLAYKARDEDRIRELQARLAIAPAGEVGEDVDALRARVAAAPDDLDARLALGKQLAADERWEEALETLLEIVRRDRGFGDDIGRRTMLDVFNLMPSGHPAVRGWRARLAQAINR
ncbi:MAG: tetratricopeptide repeat protein [Rhodocyclaceae bacterium]|nr:tetratricopeptide repeat protein [Rhodocyclaceae bacterium]